MEESGNESGGGTRGEKNAKAKAAPERPARGEATSQEGGYVIYWCPRYGIVWTTVNTGKKVKVVHGKDKDKGKVMNLPWRECP